MTNFNDVALVPRQTSAIAYHASAMQNGTLIMPIRDVSAYNHLCINVVASNSANFTIYVEWYTDPIMLGTQLNSADYKQQFRTPALLLGEQLNVPVMAPYARIRLASSDPTGAALAQYTVWGSLAERLPVTAIPNKALSTLGASSVGPGVTVTSLNERMWVGSADVRWFINDVPAGGPLIVFQVIERAYIGAGDVVLFSLTSPAGSARKDGMARISSRGIPIELQFSGVGGAGNVLCEAALVAVPA